VTTTDDLTRADLADNNVKLVKALHDAERRVAWAERETERLRALVTQDMQDIQRLDAEVLRLNTALAEWKWLYDGQRTEILQLNSQLVDQEATLLSESMEVERLQKEIASLHRDVSIRDQAIASLTNNDSEAEIAQAKAMSA
jgi:chromosome segregation ATPase